MDQHDRFTSALVHIMHIKAIDAGVVWGKRKGPVKRLSPNVDQLRLPGLRGFPADCGASGYWEESGRKYVKVWCVNSVPSEVTHSATP